MTLFSRKLAWQLFLGGSGVGNAGGIDNLALTFSLLFLLPNIPGLFMLCVGFDAVQQLWDALSHNLARL